jgi:hypothetical protein
MEKALKQITQLVGEASPEARQPVILALTKLIHSLETPDDMVQRIGGLVSPIVVSMPLSLHEQEAHTVGKIGLANVCHCDSR